MTVIGIIAVNTVGCDFIDFTAAYNGNCAVRRSAGDALCVQQRRAVSGGAGGAEARRVRPCGLPDAAAVYAAGDSAHGLGG